MSYWTLPQTVSAAGLTLSNPTLPSNGQPPTQVQIRNYSPWVLQASNGFGLPLIDPYTAVTLPITFGSPVPLSAVFDAYPNFPVGYVEAEWLLEGESATSADGAISAIQVTNSPTTRSAINPSTFLTGPIANIIGNLISTDRHITIMVFAGTISGLYKFTVTGVQSGINYHELIPPSLLDQTVLSSPQQPEGLVGVPVSCPVYGILDQQVVVTLSPMAGNWNNQISILAFPETLNQGTFTNPTRVYEQPIVKTNFMNATITGTATVLTAPNVGFVWEIDALGITFLAATTIAGSVFLVGATSGNIYLGTWCYAGGTPNPNIWIGLNGTHISEGINLSVGSSVGTTPRGIAIAALVPANY